MSLYKQLWIAIIFFMLIAFVGSFLVSCLSAVHYLEEQLYRKNVDNASSLALTLSSAEHDQVSRELYINAQFDSGHYDWIRIIDAEGKTLIKKESSNKKILAPNWIMSTFTIEAQPGVAKISNGWQQLGTLRLASNTQFAYHQLWQVVKRLFYYFFFIGITGGLIGSYLLRFITRPLDKAVDQAEAIGERRFITTDEPKTKEFKAVIRSMNKLSAHVKTMLEEETQKLEKLRQSIQIDAVTGLLNREPLLNYFHSYLKSEDTTSDGLIVAFRISSLFQLNQQEGRLNIDALLKRFGRTLTEASVNCYNGTTGRLNGSDFLLILPQAQSSETLGQDVFENLKRDCRDLKIETAIILGSSTSYHQGESVSEVLSRLDSVLESSANNDRAPFIHIPVTNVVHHQKQTLDWRSTLQTAIDEKSFVLDSFPVYSHENALLHFEAPVRLKASDNTLTRAGVFMPHINRFQMADSLDLIVLQLALNKIRETNQPVGINLSTSILIQSHSMVEFIDLVKANTDLTPNLWLEIPEYGAFQNLENFRMFCQLLKSTQCKLGIEHVAREFSRIGELHDVGLDYIKIDHSLIHDIHSITSFQVFLRGLCTIVHSIGLKAIAEGVEVEEEWEVLKDIGIDGGTGSYFSHPE